jgi:hypothetical protein
VIRVDIRYIALLMNNNLPNGVNGGVKRVQVHDI